MCLPGDGDDVFFLFLKLPVQCVRLGLFWVLPVFWVLCEDTDLFGVRLGCNYLKTLHLE